MREDLKSNVSSDCYQRDTGFFGDANGQPERESACKFIESTVTADVFAKKHDAALGHPESRGVNGARFRIQTLQERRLNHCAEYLTIGVLHVLPDDEWRPERLCQRFDAAQATARGTGHVTSARGEALSLSVQQP